MKRLVLTITLASLFAIVLSTIGLSMVATAVAQPGFRQTTQPIGWPAHPPMSFLDADGSHVLRSGGPISLARSCSLCHDTHSLATHGTHIKAGNAAWEPLAHVAGQRVKYAGAPSAQSLAMAEMNCFVCHLADPDDAARRADIAVGRSVWAVTATLGKTGLVRPTTLGWSYSPRMFQRDGTVLGSQLGLQKPSDKSCLLCHGLAQDAPGPLKLDLTSNAWSRATDGQVFSPGRMFESAVNLKGKEQLTRPWDVHAAVLLDCMDCHSLPSEPGTPPTLPSDAPRHLRFDPRLDGQDKKGAGAQSPMAGFNAQDHLAKGSRDCVDCHDAEPVHDWLPYRRRHFDRLSCEACHIADAKAPAVYQVDWTVLDEAGNPAVQWRGVEGDIADPTVLISGFTPLLLQESADERKLAPYNLAAISYWIEGDSPARPVAWNKLKAAMLDANGQYHPAVITALDGDNDGQLTAAERRLDRPEKVEAIQKRLEAIGVKNPRIRAEIQPYRIRHGVGPANSAIRSCKVCHAPDSRLTTSLKLASYLPGDVMPSLPAGSRLSLDAWLGGEKEGDENALYIGGDAQAANLYVLGHDRPWWIHTFGALMLAAALLGVSIHGGLRVIHAKKKHANKDSSEQKISRRSKEASDES